MDFRSKNTLSDEEEDLEFLRLAALQTLKKPPTTNVPLQQFHEDRPMSYGSTQQKRGRGFKSSHNRGGRNGQYNKFAQRNTNLISISTTQSDNPVQENKLVNKNDLPKLILPQDRYCNQNVDSELIKENTSKFNRYDDSHSDDDDSESDFNADSEEKSDSGSPKKLERASSLDALMDELEFEITGENKLKEKEARVTKVKVKKRKIKANTESETDTDSKNKTPEVKLIAPEFDVVTNVVDKTKKEVVEIVVSENNADATNRTNNLMFGKRTPPHIHRNRSPTVRKRSPLNGTRKVPPDFNNHGRFPPPFMQNPNNFMNPMNPYNPTIPPPFHTQRNMFTHKPHRPLSPLKINAEALSKIAMAPLSPRSAAFVLQNREIIERRKKSPRRSYSRSPSPRFRRSKSPRFEGRRSPSPNCRRSPSPRKFARSMSPKRVSPKRIGRNISPVRRNTPPRMRRNSMERKLSPKRRKTPPVKSSVRDRLGTRPKEGGIKLDVKRKHSPASDVPMKVQKPEIIEDPILEARRRKFEDAEVALKEGIIRLKPKIDETKPQIDEAKPIGDEQIDASDVPLETEPIEDSFMDDLQDILDDDVLDTKVEDIFSDEESDDENEGRFKSSAQSKRTQSVLPFTQLVNGPNRNIKIKALTENPRDNNRGYDRRDRSRCYDRERKRHRRPRSKTPTKDETTTPEKKISPERVKEAKKQSAKSRITYKPEKKADKSEHEKVRVTSPIENKKIEIKIRNPAKYETTSNYDVVNEEEMNKRKGKSARKVAVAKDLKENENNDEHEPEVIIDDDEEDVLKKNEEAGDLRAQLSRKRAERQKLPAVEDVQSRLLQNALLGVVSKKASKSKRKDKDASANDISRLEPCNEISIGLKRFSSERFSIFEEERRVRLLYQQESRLLVDKTDKVPIHLRLGLSYDSDIFMEAKKRKKSKKRDLDQV